MASHNKKWTPTEEKIFRRMAATHSVDEIALALDKSPVGVRFKLARLQAGDWDSPAGDNHYRGIRPHCKVAGNWRMEFDGKRWRQIGPVL